MRAKTFFLGDLHGNFPKLENVLRKANVSKKSDVIIFAGDLADGHPWPADCLLKLLEYENFIPLLGNHDLFLKDWAMNGNVDRRWLKIGGESTIGSLLNFKDELSEYFSKAVPFYYSEFNFFCHAGFNHKRIITKQKRLTFSVNRTMWNISKQYAKQNIKFKVVYDEENSKEIKNIFIGHSPTKNRLPAFNSNLINADTGAGNNGRLTLMDVRTKKFVQD